MQVNSINKQPNSPTFGRLIIHDKELLIKCGREYLQESFDNPLVNKFAKSSDYDLHIAYSFFNWKWKIKSVGQGFKGFINNIKTSWKPAWEFDEFNIKRYLKNHHPTLEEAKEQKLQMKLLREQEKARIRNHRAKEDEWFKEIEEIKKRKIQETNDFFNNLEQKNNPQ